MNRFLVGILLSAGLIQASTILGGSASFRYDGVLREYTDEGKFHVPFLYGQDEQAYAIFGVGGHGWCGKVTQNSRMGCDFAGMYTPEASILGGSLRNATIEAQTSWLLFKPFTLAQSTGDQSVTAKFRWVFEWILRDSSDNSILAIINGSGRGIGNLTFDGNHVLQAADMQISDVSTPEPGTFLLFSSGAALIAWAKRRKLRSYLGSSK